MRDLFGMSLITGNPDKKPPPPKPGMTDQEFWGVLYPLFENGTIDRLNQKAAARERIRRMKHEFLRLQEKNRLLKRKIRNFYKQGEGNGKSKDLG
jgi:hypothetical protein